MAAIHETAYPRIKPNLSHKELREIFTPQEEEMSLLYSKTKISLLVTRLGFMLLLKCYQYLGRPINLRKIDTPIKKYVSESLGINPTLDLCSYSKLTRHRHMKVIRKYLQINVDKKLRRQLMEKSSIRCSSNKRKLG